MPEAFAALTSGELTSTFTAGWLLVVASWALGAKIGIVIGVIKKT